MDGHAGGRNVDLVGGREGSKLRRAKKFREAFHWGNPTTSVVKRTVAKQPDVAVKLGELHSVTYKTKKKGENIELFEHEFEGRKPWLAMDVDNKRLHMLGGSYTVTADGITG